MKLIEVNPPLDKMTRVLCKLCGTFTWLARADADEPFTYVCLRCKPRPTMCSICRNEHGPEIVHACE